MFSYFFVMSSGRVFFFLFGFFFFQAEDGIRDLVRSRGLGDVYKRQDLSRVLLADAANPDPPAPLVAVLPRDAITRPAVLRLSRYTGHTLSLIHI